MSSPNDGLLKIETPQAYGGKQMYDERRKSTATIKDVELEKHGEIAIRLTQSESLCGKLLDTVRLIFSTVLLLVSAFSIIYAITEDGTKFPSNVPHWVLYLLLFAMLFIIGTMEGLQIAVVELAHEEPSKYEKYYPRAAKLLEWENQGRNVERFLIGRQVTLIFSVFIAARITSFDVFFIQDAEPWVVDFLGDYGFLGVVLVVILAQLTPQVLASAYPVEFLNLYGMNIAFGWCLLVEATGLAHAVWLLCTAVKNAFYSCLCQYHAMHVMERDFHKGSILNGEMKNGHELDDIEMSVSKRRRLRQNDRGKDYSIRNEKVAQNVDELLTQITRRPDLFCLYEDDKFPPPGYYANKFKEAGVKIPSFLSNPNDENHIPPHIMAIALLRKAVGNDNRV